MNLSDIQISLIKPRDGLVAFASVVVDGCLYLSFIGIHRKLDGSGYRLTYPTKIIGNKNFNIYHPLTKELSLAIETAVFEKFKDVINQTNGRYSGT